MDEPTQELNPNALASQIAKDAPRVAQTATETPPAAQPQPAPAPAADSATPRDKSGRAWDTTKYRTNADGTPFVNKFGNYMPAPRARGSTKAQPQPARETATAPAPRAESAPESAAPAWSEAERAEALAPSPATESETATAPAQPPVASPEATAEVASNALYTLTGAALDNHKAARPGSAEHANIKKTIAAYLAYRGILFSGGAAIVVTLIAYLIGEERREVVTERIKGFVASMRKKPLKTVQPEPAQPAPAAPSQPATAPQTALHSAFSN